MLPWRETCTFAAGAPLRSARVAGDAARAARGGDSAVAAGDGDAAPPPARERAGGGDAKRDDFERATMAILPCRVA